MNKETLFNAHTFLFTKVVIQLDLHIEIQIYQIYSSNQNLMNSSFDEIVLYLVLKVIFDEMYDCR